MPVSAAIVGRQAIIDRANSVIGYELLFRRLPTSVVARAAGDEVVSSDDMTLSVFFGALGLGFTKVTGGKTAFVNADRNVLTQHIPVTLPPSNTIVEVLESVNVDDEVLEGCRGLRENGYRLAADDFAWFDGAEKLLELVDIVKIDIQALPRSDIPSLLKRCSRYGVRLLAEKVETADELRWCRDLGFDLFQGYFLQRPQTVSGRALAPMDFNMVRLAEAALSEHIDFNTIEDILRVEPALSYRLLQLAALGRFGETKRDVRSIREALVLMGAERLRSWLPALMLRPEGRAIDSHLPAVLSRARLAELLAYERDPEWAPAAFTAGMISGFDVLLNIPRDQLLGELEVPQGLLADAFGHSTPIAQLIGDVIRYEEKRAGPSESAVDVLEMETHAGEAFSWALGAVSLLDRPVAA